MKLMKRLLSLGSPLTVHFLVYILLVSFLFMALSSGVQIFRAYSGARWELEDRLEFVENRFTASLSESLYHLDDAMMLVEMESILQLRSVSSVEILEYRGKEILEHRIGDSESLPDEERRYRLVYQDGPDGPLELGVLRIHIDMSSLIDEIRSGVMIILIVNLFLLLLIIGSVVLLIHCLVTRPLLKVVRYSEALSLDQLDKELDLGRPVRRLFPADEFDHLRNSLNAMGRRLSVSFQENERMREDKRALEEQYLQAQKMESVGRLAGGVAHDLNNLLTPILGFSDLILTAMDDDGLTGCSSQKAYLEEINKAGLKAARLVQQLLAFSRKHDAAYENIDINTLIMGFYKLLRGTLRDDVEIVLDLDPAPATVYGDTGHIEQIIMNLAVNAQDAMPKGGILTITTRQAQQSSEGRKLKIMVRDTGFGMDEETSRLVFEPFFSTKGDSGTGLGLSTVYGLVKQHGGEISLDTTPGEGCCFVISLPLIDADKASGRDNDPRMAEAGHSFGRILLVEDDDQVRRLSEKILVKEGYTVLSCSGGEEALASFPDFKPDMLLSDVVMPGMSGPELLKSCRRDRPQLKAVFMSGFTEGWLQMENLEGSFFLHKPFTIKQLRQVFRRMEQQD